MDILFWIILMTVVDGIIALIAAIFVGLGRKRMKQLLFLLVAFSAGALLSGAFMHMMAESLEVLDANTAFTYLLIGFITFFIIERFLHWHHCHEQECKVHPVSYLILFGDAIHNFIDGLIIASSFLVGVPFGIVTSLIILGHELPQEIGDYAVLLYGGMERGRALFLNFLSQMTAVVGGLVGFFLSSSLSALLLPFAAGGFLYISASDLIPEFHKDNDIRKTLKSFTMFAVGILFVAALKTYLGG
jgi:zinc and cadmium transporter